MAFRSFSHQELLLKWVCGKRAFPLAGRLMPVHSPPHPLLIPTSLIPKSAPELMKHHAVLASSFKFALWMKNILRKPLFIFSVNELKDSPSHQHALPDLSWKVVHYWARGGIIRVRQNLKEYRVKYFSGSETVNALIFHLKNIWGETVQ